MAALSMRMSRDPNVGVPHDIVGDFVNLHRVELGLN